MSNIISVNDDEFLAVVEKGLVLVDFFAEWCGPCKMLAPVIEQISNDLSGKLKVVKVDVDHAQQIAGKFEITSIPTLILFKDGKEAGRLIGLQDSDSINELISQHL